MEVKEPAIERSYFSTLIGCWGLCPVGEAKTQSNDKEGRYMKKVMVQKRDRTNDEIKEKLVIRPHPLTMSP